MSLSHRRTEELPGEIRHRILDHASRFQERVRLNFRGRFHQTLRFVGVQRLAAILEDMQVRVRPSHDPQRGREPMPARFGGGADITERCILGDDDDVAR